MAAMTADNAFKLTVDGLSTSFAVSRIDGAEGVSQLFQFDLVLLSDDKLLALPDVLGRSALLAIETHRGEHRYLSGIVSKFRQADDGHGVVVYYATIVPRIWRLQHRQDSRIFQALNVPNIIERVLTAAGLQGPDYRFVLSTSYEPRDYCVQYRESDLAFISRLMEEEGLRYFFEHTEDGHVLVIADAPSASAPITGNETLLFRPSGGALMQVSESVMSFSFAQELRPDKVSLSDFDFQNPNLSLLAAAQSAGSPQHEIFDSPGEYTTPDEGARLAKLRLEEWQSQQMAGEGASSCMRLEPGFTFKLSEHSREEYNIRYLVTKVRHHGSQAGRYGEGQQDSYRNTFECVPADVRYRPERITPRPTIKGVQTAIVTGPAGEEIHTDKHGRVKVHFHWDRAGKKDDTSSCWIRVSQQWAGAGWGAMWIPRVGHEVVVDFIEGDPDRPLITGRVYHGANTPPYALPAEKTKSTIKSNSSPGGKGFNELRFEDRAGYEEIYIHGQKDWNIVIKHDETLDVGNDKTIHVGRNRKKTVDNDQEEHIGGNKTITVAKNHTETIDKNEKLTVKGNRSTTVKKAHTERVDLSQTSTIGTAWTKSVGAAMALSVGTSKTESVQKNSTESVGANKSVQVAKNSKVEVGKNQEVSVQDNAKFKVGKDRTDEVGNNLSITVGEQIKVQCGKALITVSKDGNVTFECKDLTVTSKGDIKVKGKKVKVESEGAVDLKASGKVVVKGGDIAMN